MSAYKENALRRDKDYIRAYNREYHEKHRERISEQKKEYRRENIEREQDRQYQRHYGISLVQYDAMLDWQGGVCAICGRTPEENGQRLAVDHNHETGETRSLLCSTCNRVLGLMQDNPDMLQAASDYLKGWDNGDK